MELLTDPSIWVAFFVLAALEIVLGIDNIIFISILVGRLPPEQRHRFRKSGFQYVLGNRHSNRRGGHCVFARFGHYGGGHGEHSCAQQALGKAGGATRVISLHRALKPSYSQRANSDPATLRIGLPLELSVILTRNSELPVALVNVNISPTADHRNTATSVPPALE